MKSYLFSSTDFKLPVISFTEVSGRLFALASFIMLAAGLVHPQRIAILNPALSDGSPDAVILELGKILSSRYRLIDFSQSFYAVRDSGIENFYNLTRSQAVELSERIGCNKLILVRSEVLPRQDLQGKSYKEAFAALFVIDGKSGALIKFLLYSVKNDSENAALSSLLETLNSSSDEILQTLQLGFDESQPENYADAEKLLDEKNSKPPLPYKRIQPKYTELAFLYSVAATVEIEVFIDDQGKVTAARIMRWAGFGLDDEVKKAVLSMNWRPAFRGNTALSARALLRYNFKKFKTE